MGRIYFRGQEVKKNLNEAVKLFRLAAEQGFVRAQYNLGVIYQKGLGVTKDHQEAVKWFKRAAEQGFDPSKKSFKNYFEFSGSSNQIPLSETSKNTMDELMGNLNALKDEYLVLEAFSGGGYKDTFSENGY